MFVWKKTVWIENGYIIYPFELHYTPTRMKKDLNDKSPASSIVCNLNILLFQCLINVPVYCARIYIVYKSIKFMNCGLPVYINKSHGWRSQLNLVVIVYVTVFCIETYRSFSCNSNNRLTKCYLREAITVLWCTILWHGFIKVYHPNLKKKHSPT